MYKVNKYLHKLENCNKEIYYHKLAQHIMTGGGFNSSDIDSVFRYLQNIYKGKTQPLGQKHFTLILGRPGVGKTKNIEQTLKDVGIVDRDSCIIMDIDKIVCDKEINNITGHKALTDNLSKFLPKDMIDKDIETKYDFLRKNSGLFLELTASARKTYIDYRTKNGDLNVLSEVILYLGIFFEKNIFMETACSSDNSAYFISIFDALIYYGYMIDIYLINKEFDEKAKKGIIMRALNNGRFISEELVIEKERNCFKLYDKLKETYILKLYKIITSVPIVTGFKPMERFFLRDVDRNLLTQENFNIEDKKVVEIRETNGKKENMICDNPMEKK
jgi:hypothetical protein